MKTIRLKEIIRTLDKYSPYPSSFSFVMTSNKKKLFDNKVKESKEYIEFVIGGSAFWALQKYKTKIYAIDSCQFWIKLMCHYSIVRHIKKEDCIYII